MHDGRNPFQELIWHFSFDRWRSVLLISGILVPGVVFYPLWDHAVELLGFEITVGIASVFQLGYLYIVPDMLATRLAKRDVRIAASESYFPQWESPKRPEPEPNDDIVHDSIRYPGATLQGGFRLWAKLGKEGAWASLPDLLDRQPAPFWYVELYWKCAVPIYRGEACKGALWATTLDDLRVMLAKAILGYPDEKQVFDHATPEAILRHLEECRLDRIKKSKAIK